MFYSDKVKNFAMGHYFTNGWANGYDSLVAMAKDEVVNEEYDLFMDEENFWVVWDYEDYNRQQVVEMMMDMAYNLDETFEG